MPEVPCLHECLDDYHRYPVKKYATESVVAPQQPLIQMPEPKHEWPPCDGCCIYPDCSKPIQKDMMKDHLVQCHKMSEESAKALMANPHAVGALIQDLLRIDR